MSNEVMVNNLTNILNGLDDSQEKLEKDAFDVINSSDTSLNLVKETHVKCRRDSWNDRINE